MADSPKKKGRPPGSLNKAGDWAWSPERKRAALLIAMHELSVPEIARQVGVSAGTIYKWKNLPIFQEEVAHQFDELNRAVLRLPIAQKRKRVEILNELKAKILQVIEERAREYAGEAPGSGTGILAKTIKQVGVGQNMQIIEEWAIDVSAIREILKLDEQTAKELGQWLVRDEGFMEQKSIKREYVVIDPDDVVEGQFHDPFALPEGEASGERASEPTTHGI